MSTKDKKKKFRNNERKTRTVRTKSCESAFPGIPLHIVAPQQEEAGDAASPCSTPFPGIPLHIHHQNAVPGQGGIKKRGSWVTAKRAMQLNLCSAVHCDQGGREYMEDEHLIISELCPESESLHRCSLFAVYDGHAGGQASKLAKESFHNYIAEAEHPGVVWEEKMPELFRSFDAIVLSESQKNGDWKAGSCASLALIKGTILFTGNVGDSSVILGVKKGSESSEGGNANQDVTQAIMLSIDHKASTPEEKQRITSLGGTVLFGRVFGDLTVSRAFGDAPFKKPKVEQDFITCDPYVTRTVLNHEQHFCLIIASDGLWDKVKHDEAVKLVWENRTSPEDAAKKLVELCQSKGSKDNVTALVVIFDWKPKEDETDGESIKRAEKSLSDSEILSSNSSC